MLTGASSHSFSFVGLLIYAGVIFHKSRTGTLGRGKYAPTAGAGGAGGDLLNQNTGYAMAGGHGQAQTYPEPAYGPRDGHLHEKSHTQGVEPYGQSYYDASHDNGKNGHSVLSNSAIV